MAVCSDEGVASSGVPGRGAWVTSGSSIWKSSQSLYMLGDFSCFCCQLIFFSKLPYSKKYTRNTIRVSNSLDPDQDRNSVELLAF